MRKRDVTQALLVWAVLAGGASAAAGVEVRPDPDRNRIEINVDGRPFTAYCYGPEFAWKPVLYPVLSPGGKMLNRELTFVRPDHPETKDHPHHQALFIGYGDVAGHDFWSHAHGERIVHRAVVRAGATGDVGELEIRADWVTEDGQRIVEEHRRMRFGGGAGVRWIDLEVWLLPAGSAPVDFNDTKEGFVAFRLADALREEGGAGRYRNAYGREREAQVWGRRAPWVALTGEIQGETVTIVFFEYPDSERHPSYWHARGYGLFSVNPLGRKDFVAGAPPISRRLQPGEALHLHHRFAVYSGALTNEQLDEEYQKLVR
ncbi:MAG: PmoA family protein [Acidobacteriota bacterium]